jgi:hypothetical protein
MIIGIPWLREHNPEVDWKNGLMKFTRCPSSCGARKEFICFIHPRGEETVCNLLPPSSSFPFPLQEAIPKTPEIAIAVYSDNNEGLPSEPSFSTPPPSFSFTLHKDPSEIWLNLVENVSMRLGQVAFRNKKHTTLDDIRNGPYIDFADSVFSSEGFEKLPPSQKWDHAINLKPDFKVFNTKTCPLKEEMQPHLDQFISDNLKSRHIRYSQSEVSSGLFFIPKKEGGF